MKHLSLFSGIGGFDLAARWMGWQNIAHVEIDPFCRAVLKKNFPESKSYADIKQFDGTPYRGAIDIISGGFPCQPYSVSGKRKGTADDRHLWPEMLRVIQQVSPRWVVGENVRGLVSWSGGLVFEQVYADLEAAGYEVQAFVLPAAGIGAPHKRDRLWFVANAVFHDGGKVQTEKGNAEQRPELVVVGAPRGAWFESWPTESPLCSGDDELPAGLGGLTAARARRLVSRNRKEAIKGGGNAVVPALVLQIFQAIEQYEKLTSPIKNI